MIFLIGFSQQDRIYVKDRIHSLKGELTEHLKYNTSVIVVDHVISEKYRVGQEMQIPTVTRDWLHDSIQKNAFQPHDKYHPLIFENCYIAVLGFSDA